MLAADIPAQSTQGALQAPYFLLCFMVHCSVQHILCESKIIELFTPAERHNSYMQGDDKEGRCIQVSQY